MCRSILTLRTMDHDEADVRAAALQYVRKISGYRSPSKVNTEAFEGAVEEVTTATVRLLDSLASPRA